MPHINLLPWREVQRAERQRQFAVTAAGAAIMSALLVVLVHIQISGQIESQSARNKFLEDTIAQVDKEIAEIKTLQEDKKALLARMEIIQKLQSSRPEIVHFFEEVALNTPKGIYLTSATRGGDTLTVEGIADSNDSISAFMRKLDESPWFTNPKLNIIQSSGKSSTFKLDVVQTRPAADQGGKS
jgi:type IV pilus assembly protein PilN